MERVINYGLFLASILGIVFLGGMFFWGFSTEKLNYLHGLTILVGSLSLLGRLIINASRIARMARPVEKRADKNYEVGKLPARSRLRV